MLSYAAQNYWRLRNENRRRDVSILDAVPQRGGVRLDEARDDDQQVTKSLDTERAIQTYAAARDPDEMSDALNEVVRRWRGDNAAAGLSVLAHKPLPSGFAVDVAEHLGTLPDQDRQTVLSSMLARSDPGVKLHVAAQLKSSLMPGPVSQSPADLGSATDEDAQAHASILRNRTPKRYVEAEPSFRFSGNGGREGQDAQFGQQATGREYESRTLKRDSYDPLQVPGIAHSKSESQSDISVQATTVFDGPTPDGGYFVRRNFTLSRPADLPRGGWIVQTVRVTIQNVDDYGRPIGPPRTYEYSEAWRVAGGKNRPLQGARRYPEFGVPWANDSIGGFAQDKANGVMTVTATTRFYDGMTHLPDDFAQGTIDPAGKYTYSTITPLDQLEFKGRPGPAMTKSFPPILLKRKGRRR